jgi:hypothetical protein
MLTKNWFKIIVISSTAVAIVIFYFGVISYYKDISKQRRILKENQEKIEKMIANKDAVPSRLWIEQYNKWQAELDSEISKCERYYKDIDKTLGEWFSELTIGKDGVPSEGDFKIRYLAEKSAIIKQLKDKKIYDVSEDVDIKKQSIGEGSDLGFGEPRADNLQKLQKQFWVQQKLFADMIESNVVKYEKLKFRVSSDPEVAFLFGSVIPFSLTVIIQNKDIPIFIHKILKFQESKKTISFAILIKNICIVRLPEEINNFPEIKELEKTVPETEKNNYKPSSVRLPLSRLSLEGEVLDFNF